MFEEARAYVCARVVARACVKSVCVVHAYDDNCSGVARRGVDCLEEAGRGRQLIAPTERSGDDERAEGSGCEGRGGEGSGTTVEPNDNECSFAFHVFSFTFWTSQFSLHLLHSSVERAIRGAQVELAGERAAAADSAFRSPKTGVRLSSRAPCASTEPRFPCSSLARLLPPAFLPPATVYKPSPLLRICQIYAAVPSGMYCLGPDPEGLRNYHNYLFITSSALS